MLNYQIYRWCLFSGKIGCLKAFISLNTPKMKTGLNYYLVCKELSTLGYAARIAEGRRLEEFHSAQRHIVTIFAPNHNCKINATQGNSRQDKSLITEQTNKRKNWTTNAVEVARKCDNLYTLKSPLQSNNTLRNETDAIFFSYASSSTPHPSQSIFD